MSDKFPIKPFPAVKISGGKTVTTDKGTDAGASKPSTGFPIAEPSPTSTPKYTVPKR